jgi:hypothetical protein
MVVGLNSLDEPREDVALSVAAGFDHRQQALDEVAAGRSRGAYVSGLCSRRGM